MPSVLSGGPKLLPSGHGSPLLERQCGNSQSPEKEQYPQPGEYHGDCSRRRPSGDSRLTAHRNLIHSDRPPGQKDAEEDERQQIELDRSGEVQVRERNHRPGRTTGWARVAGKVKEDARARQPFQRQEPHGGEKGREGYDNSELSHGKSFTGTRESRL